MHLALHRVADRGGGHLGGEIVFFFRKHIAAEKVLRKRVLVPK